MRILFITDLHGDIPKYEFVFDTHRLKNVDLVVFGGDMLPSSGDFIYKQYHFIEWLKDYLRKFLSPVLIMMGNDDLIAYSDRFLSLSDLPNVGVLGFNNIVSVGDLEFIGYSYIPDVPFFLKDWCLLDNGQSPHWPMKNGCYSRLGHKYASLYKIANIFDFFKEKYLSHSLSSVPNPVNWRKTVFVSHVPPIGFGLDISFGGVSCGSYAVRDFIEEKQPLLSLHGHVHESYKMTENFFAGIGDTVCFQPGQRKRWTSYLIIDTNNILSNLEYKV